jgi:hypothetical protein
MGFLNAFSTLGRLFVAGAVACVAVAVAFNGEARMAFFIVGLSIGVTGFVFAFIGSRLGRVSGLDRRLKAVGVRGSATITSVGETGVTVNGSPVIEFGLDVDSSAHTPYSATIRQRAPRLLLGAFLPGSTVTILVDPADRAHLAIDWQAGAEVVAPSVPQPTPTPTAGGVREIEELLSSGRRATALIISMEDAGDMSELGLVEVGTAGDDDRLFIIGLEVKQSGMSPYEVRVAHRVPERLLGRVGPRTRIDVGVDRDDDHAVAIDWNTIRH